jgi:hypothetical protein
MTGWKPKCRQPNFSVEAPGERKNRITMRQIVIEDERDGETKAHGPLE